MLQGIASRMVHELDLKSVCEYPTNNLMGNNSEVFVGHDVQIRRLSRATDAANESYDLVWNFCEIEQQSNPGDLIREMLSLTRRYILIIMQNRRNPGICLHKITHCLKRRRWNHGNSALMSPAPVVKLLQAYGRIIQVGYFDVPWFILDIYESGIFLRKLIPHILSSSILHLKRSKFEDAPDFCKKFLAHHAYVLFEKS